MSASTGSFSDLNLSAPLLQALADVGYETPSPIQQACIPPLLAGQDLLGEAQTGTGKTAAFALPLLQRLDLKLMQPQILVLTPTRELAIQVAEAFQKYAKHLSGFHVLPVYGGQGMLLQLRQLRRGVHVIVGTPGRVMDHLERKSLSLEHLQALVLDEADEMLRMGFIDAVEWILEHTPATRQTALFSATMSETIRRVARTHMREPREVKIRAATQTVATITQKFWQVSGTNKLDALTRILEVDESLDAALVFVRTKTATAELAERLEARGYAAAALNGDMSQMLRERVIEQLKGGAIDIVVATDVAARGIDVSRISHVINYDIPYDTEAYVHRIGRTGRAGRAGTAILFVAPREMRMLHTIERVTRQPIEALRLPSREAVANRRVAQFKQRVNTVMEEAPLDFYAEVVAQLEREHEGDLPRIAAALLCLAQQDKPLLPPERENYAAPEEAAAPARGRERESPRRGDPREAPRRGDPREDRAPRERRPQVAELQLSGPPSPFRIAVGRNQGATPREIVGAIANEAGIGSRYIGRIELHDDHSIVELPADVPAATLAVLRRTRVCQVPLDISAAAVESRPQPAGARKPAPKDGAKRAPHREREGHAPGAGDAAPEGFAPPRRAARAPGKKPGKDA